MTPATGFTLENLLLFLGGVVGALMRVLANKDQPTRSRQSIVDLITGGLVGLMFPLFFYAFPAEWPLLIRGGVVALFAYVSSDLVTQFKGRFFPSLLPPTPNRRQTDVPKRAVTKR